MGLGSSINGNGVGGVGGKRVLPTFGVSFGLPYPSNAGYPGYPINQFGSYPAQNPHFGSISPNGLNLGLLNVNPLFSFQVTKNEYGEKLLKPLVNLHVTPNEHLISKVGNIFHAKKHGIGGAVFNKHEHFHKHHHYSEPPEVYHPHHVHDHEGHHHHHNGHHGHHGHHGHGGEEVYPSGPPSGFGGGGPSGFGGGFAPSGPYGGGGYGLDGGGGNGLYPSGPGPNNGYGYGYGSGYGHSGYGLANTDGIYRDVTGSAAVANDNNNNNYYDGQESSFDPNIFYSRSANNTSSLNQIQFQSTTNGNNNNNQEPQQNYPIINSGYANSYNYQNSIQTIPTQVPGNNRGGKMVSFPTSRRRRRETESIEKTVVVQDVDAITDDNVDDDVQERSLNTEKVMYQIVIGQNKIHKTMTHYVYTILLFYI